jgi:hypothetical protein
MTLEADLFTALTSIVDGRVFPENFPQEDYRPIWPAIRYSLVSVTEPIALCGDTQDEAPDTRVQLDLVAPTFAEARALRLEILTAMAAFLPPAIKENDFSGFDHTTKTYRVTLDYVVYKSSPQTT